MEDKNIFSVDIKKTMQSSYIDYAMSVIMARALPDVRDGLKPVQRRILYSMIELNNTYDKPHRKSARIVGDTLGKYHPHGDSAIYGALVTMAQSWNKRYILVDGHGNFGSVDGDEPAHQRYTEVRLAKISNEMVADINKDTVDFIPNFDDTEKEPVVLPSKFPNLLVNGASGIAVGMATNMPPHNLVEIINGIVKIIDNKVIEDRDTQIEELFPIIKGPDFPTGAIIIGRAGIKDAYLTGRGKIKIRAVCNIEEQNNRQQIVITELPYMVNKSRLIEKIAELVKNKVIDGIRNINDFSDREGIRVVIEIKKDANANVVLNQLYKHTQLQDSFGVINLALKNGEPKIMNLLELLIEYLNHQKNIIIRRSKFDLLKSEQRAHILEGLLIAIDNIDEIVKLIKASKTAQEAKDSLIKRFNLTDKQAQSIIEMKLRSLIGLESDKLKNELSEINKKIDYLRALLADEKKILNVIKEELLIISNKYGDKRLTKIENDVLDLEDEDLIQKKDVLLFITKVGYLKRINIDTFKLQNRGGKGIKGMQITNDDCIKDIFVTNTHDYIVFFTNKGRCYRLKVYEIPESSRTSRGIYIANLLNLTKEEKITAVISFKEYKDEYLIMATKNGKIKKTNMLKYIHIFKKGLKAIKLSENDELVSAKISNGNNEIMCISKNGQLIKFKESDVRETSRFSYGVKGMRFKDGDNLVSMQFDESDKFLLTITENGFGKRTKTNKYRVQRRGGQGIKCHKITTKTGELVDAILTNKDDEIMIMNNLGIIIREKCSQISLTGRSAMGVKVINLKEGEKVAGVTSFIKEIE